MHCAYIQISKKNPTSANERKGKRKHKDPIDSTGFDQSYPPPRSHPTSFLNAVYLDAGGDCGISVRSDDTAIFVAAKLGGSVAA